MYVESRIDFLAKVKRTKPNPDKYSEEKKHIIHTPRFNFLIIWHFTLYICIYICTFCVAVYNGSAPDHVSASLVST